MHFWQALILGIVEGITEFLPVSSTGHLLLTQRLLGLERSNTANAYAIFIQGGAIVAVMGLYRQRIFAMLGGLTRREPSSFKLATHLVLAFLPAAIFGFLLDKKIEHYLFGLPAVVFAWIAGGVALLIFSKRFQIHTIDNGGNGFALEDMTARHALWIGLAQSLALWPGTSRSLVTIVAALFLGLTMSAALEFCFLLGLVTLGAATVYKAWQFGGAMFASYGGFILATGFITSWFFAAISIKWMIDYLKSHTLALFGYWRIAIAIFAVTLLSMGMIAR